MADKDNAQIGSQVSLQRWNPSLSPQAYEEFGKVRSIAGLGVNRPEVDSTTLDSPGVERIAGLPDGKQVTIVCTTTEQSLEFAEANIGEAIDFKLDIPAPADQKRFFTLLLLDYDHGTINASGLMELTIQGRITGGAPSAIDPHGNSPVT